VQRHFILGAMGFSSLSTRTECAGEPEVDENLGLRRPEGQKIRRVYFIGDYLGSRKRNI
jgi:hypothetical protein